MTCHFWVIIIVLQWVNGLLIVLQRESTMALYWELQGEDRGQEMGCIFALRSATMLQKYLRTHNMRHHLIHGISTFFTLEPLFSANPRVPIQLSISRGGTASC